MRIIFRISQYAQGTSATNQVLTHEAYEYVFDAVPMLLALVALNAIYPGCILQGPDSGFKQVRRAEKEAKKEKKQQKKMATAEKKSQKKIEKEEKKRQKKEGSHNDVIKSHDVIDEGSPRRAHVGEERWSDDGRHHYQRDGRYEDTRYYGRQV